MAIENSLVGKQVLVVLSNGFKKTGRLLSVETNFITIEFATGKTEIVSFGNIDRISEIDGRL